MLSILSTGDLLSLGSLASLLIASAQSLPRFLQTESTLECCWPLQVCFSLSCGSTCIFSINECIHPHVYCHHMQMSPTINVFNLNFSLYFETYLVILKAVKLQLKLKLPCETTSPYSFHLFNTCFLFFLLPVTSSLFYLFTGILTLLFSDAWVQLLNPVNSTSGTFSKWKGQHCLSTWLKSYPLPNLSPLPALLHTVVCLSFIESKSVVVTPLLKHLSGLPIPWGLNPNDSGLALFVPTGLLGNWDLLVALNEESEKSKF